MDIITFLGFTLLVALISYIATKKTDEKLYTGYFLAGRNLKAPVITSSLLLTNLSTEQIVGCLTKNRLLRKNSNCFWSGDLSDLCYIR